MQQTLIVKKDLTYGGMFPNGMTWRCKKCDRQINEIRDVCIWWKHWVYCEKCGVKWKDLHKTAGDE